MNFMLANTPNFAQVACTPALVTVTDANALHHNLTTLLNWKFVSPL